jgi:MSHA biogenesis protein MshN
VRKEGREAQEAKVPALPASPPPAPVQSFLSLDMDTSQLAPASVRKVMLLTPEAEAQQYYDEAQALRRAGKLDAAMGKYRQALERNPAMTGARLQLVRLLQDKGQVDAALALLKAGYELRADDGLAIAAGRLLADRGQRESALDWLQRGQSSWRPADHALMGALLSQAHRYEEASRAYRQALAADPGQGGWLLGLGLALEAQGRLEEARMVYRNALERGQFKPEVIRFLQEHSGVSGQ